MKKIYFLFLFSSVLFLACKKPAPTPHSTEVVNVKYKDCTPIADNKAAVKICLDSILQDSRCPINALCVWQGVAEVKFSLHLNGVAYPFTLATHQITGGTSTTAVVQQFKIFLRNLYPYPGTSIEPYYAELEVTKL